MSLVRSRSMPPPTLRVATSGRAIATAESTSSSMLPRELIRLKSTIMLSRGAIAPEPLLRVANVKSGGIHAVPRPHCHFYSSGTERPPRREFWMIKGDAKIHNRATTASGMRAHGDLGESFADYSDFTPPRGSQSYNSPAPPHRARDNPC